MILQEQWDAVIQAISSGLKKKDAIEIAGISETAFFDRQKDDADFSELVKKAELAFKLRHIKNIEEKSDDNWQCSAWLLERKFKGEFGKEQKVEHTFNPIKEINITENGRPRLEHDNDIQEEQNGTE